MIPPQVPDVPVRWLGEGRVLIGWQRSIPSEGEIIALHGSHVTVDPARPDAIPTCLITDMDAAEVPLSVLYGADAVIVAGQVWSSGSTAEAVCTVAAGDELNQLSRLGEVRWCRQFSPLPLDDLLLWLEELTLVGQLQAVLEDEEEWSLDLERSCGRLIDRTGAGVAADAAVESLLIEALELLATTLLVGDPLSIGARGQLAARDLLTLPTETGAPSDIVIDLPDPLAMVAGDGAFEGADTVDWFDVPRGVTSQSEGNVRWTLELTDTRADITVTVDGPPPIWRYGGSAAEWEEPSLPQLAFDAYVPEWPLAVLTGPLHFDRTGWAWVGDVGVRDAQADLIRETIDAGHRPVLRVRSLALGPAQHPTWARAHRWTCRGLGTARVAKGWPERVSAATAAWLRAADLWRLVGRDDNADECEQLADDLNRGSLDQRLTVAERWLLGG